jgi:hypothetical protein
MEPCRKILFFFASFILRDKVYVTGHILIISAQQIELKWITVFYGSSMPALKLLGSYVKWKSY